MNCEHDRENLGTSAEPFSNGLIPLWVEQT